MIVGTSDSNKSFDKLENSRGGRDYWVVKLDDLGNKVWDRTYGGSEKDLGNGAVEVTGGGYLIWGSSYSPADGDRTVENKGFSDYWIVRIDADGNKLWDKAYGGDSHDYCYDLITTEGGGYLLGGVSKSASGDVSESGRGAEDYWIVKIDADGNKIWDKRFGGNSYDSLERISQTSDGGYLLAGDSTSNNASGDKSDNGKGGNDYWVVRIDASGNKLWDKTYGGSGDDWFSGLTQTDNGGFLLNGSSESNQTETRRKVVEITLATGWSESIPAETNCGTKL